MKLQVLLFALLALAANAAMAACNANSIGGSWALLGYGWYPSNTTIGVNKTTPTSSINIIGVLKLQQGQVRLGWVTFKHGTTVWDYTNVTGTYSAVGKPCLIHLNVSADNGNTTFASYRGTLSLDGKHVELIALNSKETIIARLDKLATCNAQSIRDVWTAASIRQYSGYSVSKLETIDCSKTKKWCSFWELGTNTNWAYGVNATIVNVTMNADGKHPCAWTFQNGTVADGYIAVPFGLGMNVIQSTTKYSLATTYYRGAQ